MTKKFKIYEVKVNDECGNTENSEKGGQDY